MARPRILYPDSAALLVLLVLLAAPLPAAQEPGSETVQLTVEGISASLGEDEPRVLYILPWQPPSLPRRPRVELDDKAPELLGPVDPMVFERHRLFRDTLNPLILSPFGASAVTVQ